MNGFRKVCILHALAGAAVLSGFACSDDVTYGPEAGPPKSDATIDQSTTDAGGEASSASLLMTYSAASGELVALDTTSKQIGRLAMPGFGVALRSGKDTFLLETGQDLVGRLDTSTYASIAASWNVALTDAFDGGFAYADPVQVIEVAANKAYVLRYNRNRIAIIDPSQSADAGAPISSIDLSSLVQSKDGDGAVDMTAAVFDSTRNRLYVALGNIDLTYTDPQGFFILCAGTQSTLIAIDTTNDTLVNLGGAGPGGGVVLGGYGAQSSYLNGVWLDSVGDRVVILSTGCNAPTTDGGKGALSGRVVEAVDLKTNTTHTLLDANAQDYPGQFLYIDATHAYVQFGYGAFSTTYAWDPTTTALGAPLTTTPDVFDYDNAGHILGPQSTLAADGAAGPINVISVTLADGGVVQLAQNPFLQSGGFIGNAIYAP